jgi:hypothetical protein
MDLVTSQDVSGVARTPEAKRRPVRWMPLMVALFAFSLVALVLGFLIHDQIGEHQRYARLDAAFGITRHRSDHEADDLAELSHDVTRLDANLKTDSATWQQDEAQLKAAAAALAVSQADVSQQRSRITALHACLGGVQQALNALAVNNQSGAFADLNSVGSSCAAASGG